MKFFSTLLLVFSLAFSGLTASAAPIGKKSFEHVIYVAYGGSSSYSGGDYITPKPISDGNLWAIPAGAVIENVFVVVDTLVAGITAFNLGDADTASGFIVSASGTLETTGLYYWGTDYKGAYLKSSNVVANHWEAKYYPASGKYLALDVTGTASAGKFRVIVRGYQVD